MKVRNPILPGFNPDPSICRVGDDYYIATSTFEWFPGVQIHHSTDLANWRLLTRPLTRASQLDMRGAPDSGGVWAPCLTYNDGLFWLVYTNMRRHQGSVKDGMNYVVTAPAIEGPWSDAVALNASGFDPSLFHDDDGRSWLLQMLWEHDGSPTHFAGISVQEFDCDTTALVGERHLIFEGSDLGLTEGPHIYKRNGWYHLLTAEGGTGYDHACTWARSRDLLGPYELHPDVEILTSRHDPGYPMQRAGHGDLVETADGEPYLVHLMSRPIGDRCSVLGRETSIQECEWRDDWLWVKDGPLPALDVTLDAETAKPESARHYTFDDGLPLDFQWLRTPEPQRLFEFADGKLRLFGRESIGSWHEQSLVARRQTEFAYRAETEVVFDPKDTLEMAGLTAYYSRNSLYFLAVTCDPAGNRVLRIIAAMADNRGGKYSYPGEAVALPGVGPVRLAVSVVHEVLKFQYALPDKEFVDIGPELDATILSDEASVAVGGGCFTGAFVGVCAVDMNGLGKPADFAWLDYVAVS
jgi:xylan 1,4-beta-xylosidase